MKIGIIGGSGLYHIESITQQEWIKVETPFGAPSDEYLHGTLEGREVYFLPRHGRGHVFLPSELNHRANLFGFKALGVEQVISVSAVGSLREDLHPRDVIFPDQYFDRTKRSEDHTFFGKGIVAHIPFGEPVCTELREQLFRATQQVLSSNEQYKNLHAHATGTYVNMEGPAFSTKAESRFHRQCGFDVIGMTSLAEAKLAREAEICYVTMAMVTDYDCWHEELESVTLEMVLSNLLANTTLAQDILRLHLRQSPAQRTCPCDSMLKTAIVTEAARVPEERKKALRPIIGKYIQ